MVGRSRFAVPRSGAQSQVQGRWSLTAPVFGGLGGDGSGSAGTSGAERRRALAELLLERYGIVTREQVLAEQVKGGFAALYETFCNLETLGVCRRGYFIEGMGGAQFALPGAVERLRAAKAGLPAGTVQPGRALVLAAADPAQPYGAALGWPRPALGDGEEGVRAQGRRPARVAGAYVVLVDGEPVLYVQRGGRGLLTLTVARAAAVSPPSAVGAGPQAERLREALGALAAAVRAGRVPKLALERIDGEPAIASELVGSLIELGFHSGPRRLTLTA
jgi:ATP-dependent Lhr-like helicase